MSFPIEPTENLPLWAYGGSALKVDPGDPIREQGWDFAGPGLTYGQAPPFQWVNNELFNNGQWASYFKDALDYLKGGSFDNGIEIFGNKYLTFYTSDDSTYIRFQAGVTSLGNQTYTWPNTGPSALNNFLTCDVDGQLSWETTRPVVVAVTIPAHAAPLDYYLSFANPAIYNDEGAYNFIVGAAGTIFKVAIAGKYILRIDINLQLENPFSSSLPFELIFYKNGAPFDLFRSYIVNNDNETFTVNKNIPVSYNDEVAIFITDPGALISPIFIPVSPGGAIMFTLIPNLYVRVQ